MHEGKTPDHVLKTWPEFFEAILHNRKKAEFRNNDRNFTVGQVVCLEEFERYRQEKTGRAIFVEITHVTDCTTFAPGFGFVCFSFERLYAFPANIMEEN